MSVVVHAIALANRSTYGGTSAIEISASEFVVDNRLAVAITPGLRVLGAVLPLANIENCFGFYSDIGKNEKRSR